MKQLILFSNDGCPMWYACKAIEGKWKLPMIYVLHENGTLRYGELKKALGITSVMLSSTLKDLEQEGLVIRTQYQEIPVRVEYSLTEMALQLVPILEMLEKWGVQLAQSGHCLPGKEEAESSGCPAGKSTEKKNEGSKE